jgi:hypothetical protein
MAKTRFEMDENPPLNPMGMEVIENIEKY